MAAISPPPVPNGAIRRAAAQRGVGMAMVGSTIALLGMAALAWAGVLSVAEDIRVWTAAGIAVAAVIDGGIGLFFLRASSQP